MCVGRMCGEAGRGVRQYRAGRLGVGVGRGWLLIPYSGSVIDPPQCFQKARRPLYAIKNKMLLCSVKGK